MREMIGATRSRVSFFMNRFREAGLIDYDGGRIEVRGSLLTVVLNDQPHVGLDRARYETIGEIAFN